MLNDFTATTLTGNPLIIKELLPKGACDFGRVRLQNHARLPQRPELVLPEAGGGREGLIGNRYLLIGRCWDQPPRASSQRNAGYWLAVRLSSCCVLRGSVAF